MRKLIILILVLSFYLVSFAEEWVEISTVPGKTIDRVRIEMLNDNDISFGGNQGLITSKVINSIDGGKSFEVLFEDTIKQVANNEIRMYSFHHEHKDHYLIMCSRLNYRYSSDAGKTWRYDSLRGGSSGELEASTFNNNALLVYGDIIYRSTDYGNTWESIEYQVNHNYNLEKGRIILYNYSYMTENTLIAELQYFIDFYHEDNVYSTVVSNDNGKTWKIVFEKDKRNNFNYTLTKNGRIVGVGARQVEPYKSPEFDVIKYSDDGGYSWTTVLDTVTNYYPVGIRDVRMNGKYGVAYQRSSYKLWRTSDNGETWELDRTIDDIYPSPEDYNVFSNGDLITTLPTGEIYKWTDPTLSAESEINISQENILLYPNPTNTNEGVNVEFTTKHSGLVEISLIDMTGKGVSSTNKQAISGTELKFKFVPEEKLAAGMYFIQIGYQNGEAYREKLIVE